LAAATNPAGMVLVGNRADLGLDWFSPKRDATIGGANYVSGTNNFFIPEAGYNQLLSNESSLGVSIFGNGGMNTDYPNIPNFNIAGKRVGINLEQLFIAPTWATKLSPTNAVGISLNLAYQKFSASGLDNFNPASASGANLTGNGSESSTGWGVRLGWNGQVTPDVTLGATYQSKTKMGKFSKYSGLFAEQGGFDIPENYGVGIAVKAGQATTLAVDVVQINYSKVASVANPISQLPVAFLGNNNGAGFGWKDQTVFKFGGVYEYSKELTLRAGYNQGSSTIPDTELAFNVLAPATVEKHITLGATWILATKSELSLAYVHAFSNSLTGATPQLVSTPTTISMHQDSLGIAYGWKF
jgi:long-chain fatty acid transport protein